MTNNQLIDELIRGGYLTTPLLIEAFRKIDRRDFVPDELQEFAYADEPLSIGFGQTISQPLTVAFMFELLAPEPDQKILDVGSGSGWTTAILGYIAAYKILDVAEPVINPKVIGIERIHELKVFAERNIEKYGFITKGFVELVEGDAGQGISGDLFPRYGFDRIIAAASASEIPFVWKRQLAVGGRIVAPVGNSIVVLRKDSQDGFTKKEYPGFSFVPLVSNGSSG